MMKPDIDEDMYADLIRSGEPQPEQFQAHAPAKFCNAECRIGYREERIDNILLPLHECEGKTIHYLDMCSARGECAYCRDKLKEAHDSTSE